MEEKLSTIYLRDGRNALQYRHRDGSELSSLVS